MRIAKCLPVVGIAVGFMAGFAGCDFNQAHKAVEADTSTPATVATVGNDTPDPAHVPASYTKHLIDQATKLGEREIARMSAAELIYRNQSFLNESAIKGDVLAPGFGMYLKIYRSFTGFKIKDIYRSESFLYPVAYDIEYDFDLLGTTPRVYSDPKSVELSAADTQFNLIGRYNLTRRYKVDAQGNYTGTLPELPPRANFSTRGLPEEVEEGEALPNRLPAGGFPPGGPKLEPAGRNWPPAPGGTFQTTIPE